jgi:hypothetical protein
MTEFSVSDVAFEGFRLTRERPGAIAVWVAVEIVLLVITASLIASNPAFVQLADLMARLQSDPQGIMPRIQALAPSILPTLAKTAPISLVIGIILRTAIYRAILRPQETSLGFIRLGLDEVRVFLVSLLIGLIVAAAIMVDGITVGALSLAGPVGGVLALVFLLATLAVVIAVLLRLSLAAPQSFAERKLNLFGSWKLTKPVFWPMVGSYLIAGILWVVVFVLLNAIRNGIGAVMGGGGTQAMLGVGALALTKPLGLLELALEAAFAGLGVAILNSPSAMIYQIVTRLGAKAEDSF